MNKYRLQTGLILILLFLFLPIANTFDLSMIQINLAIAGEPAKGTWEGKWNETVAAAKKEGALLVYTSASTPAVRQIAPKIKELFGLNMEVIGAPNEELTQRFLTEGQRGLHYADAFIAGTQLVNATYNGVFSPLEKALILPDASDPKAWSNGELPFLDKKNRRTLIMLTGAYWSYILVNTDMVREGELKSYEDLILPKWKGKLIMFDPSGGGGAVNWVTYIMRIMGPEKGEKFLRQLATQQDLIITRDVRLQGEWVARGKYPVAIAPSIAVVPTLIKAGAPISWIRMSEGGVVHPAASVFGIVDKAPHPNAAKVLFNWLLTAEGQHVFSQAFGQPASRLKISAKGLDPFTVPRPEEKAFWIDEEFIRRVETQGRQWGKEIFGSLLK